MFPYFFDSIHKSWYWLLLTCSQQGLQVCSQWVPNGLLLSLNLETYQKRNRFQFLSNARVIARSFSGFFLSLLSQMLKLWVHVVNTVRSVSQSLALALCRSTKRNNFENHRRFSGWGQVHLESNDKLSGQTELLISQIVETRQSFGHSDVYPLHQLKMF